MDSEMSLVLHASANRLRGMFSRLEPQSHETRQKIDARRHERLGAARLAE